MGLRRRTELILWGLLVALAIIWGTLSALERVGVNWLLYARLQAEANVVETSGISEDDLIAMDIALSDLSEGGFLRAGDAGGRGGWAAPAGVQRP